MKRLGIFMMMLIVSVSLFAQNQSNKTVAVIDIDTEGILSDPKLVSKMVQTEMEKTKLYHVSDRYDIEASLKKQNLEISDCYGQSCAITIGIALDVEYVVTGSVSRFGEKLIFKLRMFDVRTNKLHLSAVREFHNLPKHISSMAKITVNDLVGVENDELLVQQLSMVVTPIIDKAVRVRANGPRMGIGYVDFGSNKYDSKTWLGSKEKYSVISQFGYQFETQYLSSGNFQALFEAVFIVGGMDQGLFIPTGLIMNGFRNTKNGLELAFGPTMSVTTDYKKSILNDKEEYKLSSGWVWSVGKTFQSGNLNIPVNIYVSPDKQNGWYYGMSFGFNLAKTTSKGY